MSTQWLAIQSFQYDRDLITAINILSIHIKLELAGKSKAEKIQRVNEARDTLKSFFERLETLIDEREQGDTTPILGTTQRLRQLAKNFVSATNNSGEFHSILFHNNLSQTQALLYSDKKEDKEALILCLEELRRLIEEHVHVDTERIFGEV
ncbi:MAG: hypothetical protein HC820_01360 [Hydrococcus sp. RM1_1_31]|nr:hypothetical protein [Hydrococcus sp. RM1_1_31]